MGITKGFLDYLGKRCKQHGITGSVLTFSRLETYFDFDTLIEVAVRHGHLPAPLDGNIDLPDSHPMLALLNSGQHLSHHAEFRDKGYPSDQAVFYALGFSEAESLDVSDAEGANYRYDLNQDCISSVIPKQYDLVIEAGTMEHVFHVPNVLKNAFHATKVGGYILHSSPANNFCDHGFYQFSPTLFVDYYAANGFVVVEALLLQIASNESPWFVLDYSPGALASTQYGGLDDKMYGVVCLVRKTAQSTCDKIPLQGSYLNNPEWRQGLAGA
ncbi:hypothetical protein [Methylogaea oryzae]|uniref:Methyltransferase domain-containing protein n=1 Tax=Methylogaea oryzae TaxID=1295382 RepID=A0A8D4VNR3_9GAMM|nr:hypothetical protein [Methylogaea oryzae]BBL71588.1 hypothetical protein MoryE10_21940 [Methylogaea oryzae]